MIIYGTDDDDSGESSISFTADEIRSGDFNILKESYSQLNKLVK